MPAELKEKTRIKLLLTAKQRRQLTKLLYEAQPQGPHYKTLQRLDRLAASFANDLSNVGFRPHTEVIIRTLGSESVRQKFIRRRTKMSPTERNVENKGWSKRRTCCVALSGTFHEFGRTPQVRCYPR